MEPVKPTWRMAAQISFTHTRISNRITGVLVLILLVITAVTMILTGHHFSFINWMNFLNQYKWTLIPIILLIHFIPVNLYAVRKTLQYHYPHFKIILIPTDENTHENDYRNHQTRQDG